MTVMRGDRIISLLLSVLVFSSALTGSVALFAAGTASAAPNADLFVDPSNASDPDTYSTIQKAINNANDGDVIVVNESSTPYAGPVIVNKSVTLFANGDVVVDGRNQDASAFIIRNASRASFSDVRIDGFEIRNFSASTRFQGHGILINHTDADNISIRNNTIHDMGGSGILANDQVSLQDVRIRNNTVSNVSGNGILLFARGGTLESVSVRNNTVRNVSGSGILISAVRTATTRDLVLLNNTIESPIGAAGLNASLSGNSTLRNVTVSGTEARNLTDAATFTATNATITELDIEANDFRNASGTSLSISAVAVTSSDTANVTTVNVTQNALNRSEVGLSLNGTVVTISSSSFANVSDVLVSENNVSDSATVGLRTTLTGDGELQDLNVSDNGFLRGDTRILLDLSGSSTADEVLVENNALNRSNAGVGVDVSAAGTATLTDLTVTENNVSEVGTGIRFTLRDDATVTRADVDENDLSGAAGSAAVLVDVGSASTDDASLSLLNVTSNALNESSQPGLSVVTAGDGTVDEVNVSGNDFAAGSATRVRVNATESSNVTDVTVTENSFEGVSATAIEVAARGGGIGNVTVEANAINRTGTAAVLLNASSPGPATGWLSNVTVVSNNLTGNSYPVTVNATDDATVREVNVSTNDLRDTGTTAVRVLAGGAGGSPTVDGVHIEENLLNGTATTGVSVDAAGSATVTGLNLTTNVFTNASGTGLRVEVTGSADLTDSTVTENSFENASATPVEVVASDGRVEDLTVESNALNRTGQTGLNVTVTGTGVVSNLTVDTNNVSANAVGVTFDLSGTASLRDVLLTTNDFRNVSTRGLELLAGSTASDDVTVRNVTVEENALNESDVPAVVLESWGTSLVEDVNVTTNDFRNASGDRLTVTLFNDSAVSGLTLHQNTFEGETGPRFTVTDSARLDNLTVTDNALNRTGGAGLSLAARENATLADVSVTTNNLTENAVGVDVSLVDNATLTDLYVSEALVTDSDAGVNLTAGQSASATVDVRNVTVVDSALNRTTTTGLSVEAAGNASVTDLAVESANASDATVGFEFVATGEASITAVNLTEVAAKRSGSAGVLLRAGESASAAATLDDITVQEAALNASTDVGLAVRAAGSSTVGNLTLDTADLTTARVGVHVRLVNDSAFRDAAFTDVTFENVGETGLRVRAVDRTTVQNVSLSSAALNRTVEGVDLDALDNATVSELSLSSVNLSDDTRPLTVTLADDASLTDLDLSEVLVAGSDRGVTLRIGTTSSANASVRDVFATSVGINETAGVGLAMTVVGDSSLSNVTVDTADASNNTEGVNLTAVDTATVTDVNLTSVRAQNSTNAAVSAVFADRASLEGLNATEVAFNDSNPVGLAVAATDSATLTNVTVSTANLTENGVAARFDLRGDASVTDLELSELLVARSTDGVVLDAGATNGANVTVEGVSVTSAGINETADTGLAVTVRGDSSLSNLSVDTAEASDNAEGVNLTAVDTATVSNVTLTSVRAQNNTGAGVHVGLADSATLSGLTVDEAALNDSNPVGFEFAATDSASATDVRLASVNLTDDTTAVRFSLSGDSSLSNVTVDTVLVRDSGDGLVLRAGLTDTANVTVEGVTVTSAGINGTAGVGLAATVRGDSALRNLTVDTAEASDNAEGVNLTAVDTATVSNVTLTSVRAQNNTDAGVQVLLHESATLDELAVEEVAFNDSNPVGFAVDVAGDASASDVALDTADLTENGVAAAFNLTGTSSLTNLSVRRVIVENSTRGVLVRAGETASDDVTVENVTATESGLNGTDTTGFAVLATGSSTVRDVRLDTVDAGTNDVGVRLLAADTATLRAVNLTTMRAPENARRGVVVAAGADGGDGATVRNVTVRTVLVENTTNGAGLAFVSRGSSTLANASVSQALLAGNDVAVNVTVTDTASADVGVFRALLQNGTTAGLAVDVGPDASASVSARQSLFRDNDGPAVRASSTTPTGAVDVHRSLLLRNAAGVVNNNATGLVDARFNYWGDSSGPSSATADPLSDPVAPVTANGDGDSVSEGAIAGEANVRFAPAVCGKNPGDPQLVAPVPSRTVERTIQGRTIQGRTIAGETLSVDISECVGLFAWERSVLPLRTDDADAATKVRLPQVFVRTSEGDVSINRDYLTVYNPDTQVTLNFDDVTGANTTRFAGREVRLVVFRLAANVTTNESLSALLDPDVNTTRDNLSFGVTAETNNTLLVDADGNVSRGNLSIKSDLVTVIAERSVGTLDAEGETTVSFTPPASGDYVALLTTVRTGDGLNATPDGGLTFNLLNDSSAVLGVETVTVQTRNSTVTPNRTEVPETSRLNFTAQSNLNADSVGHVLVTYNKTSFERRTIVFNNTNVTDLANNATLLTVNGTSDGEAFFLQVNVSDNGTVLGFETGGSLAGVDSSAVSVVDGNATENVSLRVGQNANLSAGENATYQFVHVAVNRSDPRDRSTDTGTFTVFAAPPSEVRVVGASLSDTTIFVGQSVDVTATLENPGENATNRTINLTVDGTVVERRNVTLSATTTTTETFTLTFNSSGTFDVAVSGTAAGTVTVEQFTGAGVAVIDAGLNRTEIVRGETVRVSAELGNPGDESATRTINVTADGTVVARRTVTLAAGESRTETFDVTFNATGNFTVAVEDERAGFVNVSEAPAAVEAVNASLNRTEVAVGEPVNVSVVFENPGNVSVTRLVNVTVNGTVVEQRNVTLAPGETRTETFTLVFNETGEFEVVVDDVSVNVTVVRPEATVEVVTADLNRTQIPVGGTVTVSATVENPGNASATRTINVTADGEVVARRNVTLAPGESRTETFEVTFNESGRFDVAVSGTAAGTLTVGQPPAAVEVVEASLNRSVMAPGETVAVSAVLENPGNESATRIINVTVDGTVVARRNVTLAPGESRTETFELSFEVTGDLTIEVSGVRAGVLTVREPVGAVEVVSASVTPTTVEAGGTVTVSAVLENPGNESATRTLNVTADGEVVARRTVTLGPGESRTETFDVTLSEVGSVELAVSGVVAGTVSVTAPPEPGAVNVANAQLNDTTVAPGGSVAVVVTLQNPGDAEATRTLAVAVDGTVRAERTVTLAGGATDTQRFVLTFQQAGSFEVTVGGVLAGTVSVQAVEQPTEPAEPPVDIEPDPEENETTVDVVEVPADTPVSIDVDREGQALRNATKAGGASLEGLDLNASQDIENLQLSVAASTQPPAGTPPVTGGTALSYLNITVNVGEDAFNSVTFRFTIDNESLPEGIPPENVRLFRYNESAGEWQSLPTEYLGGERYRATSPGFSVFAIGYQSPPSFAVTDATLGETTVPAGQSVEVTATVENTGDLEGTFQANLTVDGEVVETKTVTVPGDDSTTVTFTLTIEEPGSYSVVVSGGVAGTLEVTAVETPTATPTPSPTPRITPTASPTATATPTPAPAVGLFGLGPVTLGLVLLVVVVIAAAAIYYSRGSE